MSFDLQKEFPEIARVFGKAMDEYADLVARDDGTIYGSPGQRRGAAFAQAQAFRKRWKKKIKCVFPGCSERTLDSHTIQRGGPLKVISEGRRVLTPRLDLGAKGLVMTEVGIGEASTFPGFCSTHEQLFSEFEQTGDLTKDRHVALQVFRTVCREVVRTQLQIANVEAGLEKYDGLVAHQGIKFIASQIEQSFRISENLKITDVSLEGVSNARARVLKALEEARNTMRMLQKNFFNQALGDATGGAEGLAHFQITVEQTVPFCLAGLGNFHIQEGNKVTNVVAILNVWPTTTKTIITMAVQNEHKDALNLYVDNCLKKILGLVTMLETWMVNGSDHWFITPSAWRKIPSTRQNQILKDILDPTYSIGQSYPRSILDDLRADTLRLVSNGPLSEDAEGEFAKLSDIE